jgi:enoyl-CoA hydratase
MEAGSSQIGLNEVAIGIPFPAAPFEIAQRATPARSAGSVLLEGRRFSPAEALAAGIVDEVATGCLGAAIAQARRFAAGGAEAVADTKKDLVAPALARIDATAAAKRERFLDRWFSADTRARIGAVRDRLVKPRP